MTPDAALIRDLLAVLGRSGMAFAPAIGGVFRALVTLDGTLRALAPGFDIAAESEAIARQLAGEQLIPASLRDAAAGELLTLLPMLRKLPRRADRITAALAQGRFTTNLRLFSDPHDVSVITGLVNRAVLGLLGSALGVMSVILLPGPRLAPRRQRHHRPSAVRIRRPVPRGHADSPRRPGNPQPASAPLTGNQRRSRRTWPQRRSTGRSVEISS